MFKINSFKTSREDKFMPINKVRASVRINQITVSQPHVIIKKHVNSDSNGLFSIGIDNTTKTRRPQPRSNTKNDKVPSASKSRNLQSNSFQIPLLFLPGYPNLFMVPQFGLFQAYERESKASHQFCLEVFGNLIMEYLVKISKKTRILELKRRQLKITVLKSYTSYPSRRIRGIRGYTSQVTTKD
nr:hypothetical protein [Tanacetum cinerariifolium]